MSQAKATRKGGRPAASPAPELSLSHLRRDTRTALELAVVALAPSEVLDPLARAAGMLEALVELPSNSPPALALTPGLVKHTREALETWQKWQRENLAKKMPRG